VIDDKTELNFDFDNAPRKFIDVETGEEVNLFAETSKNHTKKNVQIYFKKIAQTCVHKTKLSMFRKCWVPILKKYLPHTWLKNKSFG
jgi:hypothetical protein